MIDFAILFFVWFLTFSMSAICGGGASILLIPILEIYLPIIQVPGALSIGTTSSSIQKLLL